MISIKIEFKIISCIILTSVVKMKVIFLCVCLFLFSTISWERENATRSHSILSFFNNLMSHQLRQITSGQDSTSVSGFIRDWVGAYQYHRGEISFNATVPPLPFCLVASNSSQKPKCEVRGPKPQLLVFINFTLISHSELKINLDVHPSWVLSLLSSLIDIVVSTSLFR